MPRLSAIVVNYNGGDMVIRCVDSLLKNPPEGDIEVIVVDNASSDDSPEKLAARDDIVFIQSEQNLGFAAGCNLGLERAAGEYLALINPDVEVGSGLCDGVIGFLRDTEGAGIASPLLKSPDGSIQNNFRRYPSLWLMLGSRRSPLTLLWPKNPISSRFFYSDLSLTKPREVEMVSGTALFFTRGVYDAIGGLDPGYFMFVEDADFCLRVARAGYGVYSLPDLSVEHYLSYSVQKRPYSMILAHHRSLLRFFFRHRPFHFVAYIMLWPLALSYILMEFLLASLKRR